ncbi:hypothetical protein [Amycolatopsis sp. cmx-4-61]|uniref:hypothetical protein n=1 Tax=Amycolatopsis sp. cmx-4-61 TaxID=2790937 RepID=UPI00397BA479
MTSANTPLNDDCVCGDPLSDTSNGELAAAPCGNHFLHSNCWNTLVQTATRERQPKNEFDMIATNLNIQTGGISEVSGVAAKLKEGSFSNTVSCPWCRQTQQVASVDNTRYLWLAEIRDRDAFGTGFEPETWAVPLTDFFQQLLIHQRFIYPDETTYYILPEGVHVNDVVFSRGATTLFWWKESPAIRNVSATEMHLPAIRTNVAEMSRLANQGENLSADGRRQIYLLFRVLADIFDDIADRDPTGMMRLSRQNGFSDPYVYLLNNKLDGSAKIDFPTLARQLDMLSQFLANPNLT